MSRAVVTVMLWAAAAQAGVSGQASVQGQVQTLETKAPNGVTIGTRALTLSENLGIHYTGTPFGANAVLLSAGFEGMNMNAFGDAGALMSGRTGTIDLSVGLFPRRALPVRLYARGTLTDGGPQSFASFGGREAIAFGVNLNLEPGKYLPGLRLDAEQMNYTALGSNRTLGDLRRTLNATLFKQFGEHQVNLTTRLMQESRVLTGDWLGVFLIGTWTSPRHTTTLMADHIDRSRLAVQLPGQAPTTVVERNARLSHQQRWTPRLFTDVSLRVTDARFPTAWGTQGGGTVGASWQPFEQHELVMSGSADVGFAATSTNTRVGSLSGGSARAGYGRSFGYVRPGVSVGGLAQHCANCVGLVDGWLGAFDVGASVATMGFTRFDAQLEYRMALVRAPAGRGGNRTEHHAKGTGRFRINSRSEVYALVGYDDGYRDFIDVLSGGIATLREQAFTVGGGVQATLGRGTGSLDARHSRGNAVIPQSTFTFGPPPTAREVTQLNATVLLPVLPWLDTSAGGVAAWTVIDNTQPLTTFGGNVGASARFGRFTSTLAWSVMRNDVSGSVTTQHLVRLSLSRPFDF
ncbi:MAG: hypothetical protein JNJ54_29610 [Myxococcaceae bacterium]|nr:hypothetical protein [Myxococcaceae bacterium]